MPMWTKEQYKAYQAEAYRRCKERFQGPWWFQENEPLARFTGWVAAYTGVLVVVSALQFCTLNNTDRTTREALVAGNRAWLAPISGTFQKPPVLGQPILLVVNYQNTGREPARSSVHFQSVWKVNTTKNLGGGVRFTPVPNTTCNGLVPSEGSQTIYPSATQFYQSSIPPRADFVVDNALINQDIILQWQGCFVYLTFDSPHKSAFCFWLRPIDNEPITNWSWNFCTSGNFAD